MRRALAAFALPLLALGGCATQARPGTTGASIAILPGGQVAVVDADQGSVSFVDGDSLALMAQLGVGPEPRALLLGASGLLYAVTRRGGELVEIALDRGPRITRHVPVCTGPRALAQAPSGRLLVACEWDGTVRAIDPGTLAVSTLAMGLSRPAAVTALDEATYVVEAQRGQLTRIGADGTIAGSLVPSEDRERPALTAMSAHNAFSITTLGGGLAVVFELVNHDGNATLESIVDDYGSVADGTPKINPALRKLSASLAEELTPTTYARYDGDPSLRCNGPSALVELDDERVLITHQGSADLAIVTLGGASSSTRLGAIYKVGGGPAGVAIDRGRHVAWVDDALDGSISRVDLSLEPSVAVTTLVRALPSVASQAALAGRRLFHDATNTHVTPSGVLACATCHPDGGEDGLTWFIRAPTIPAKLRRTPSLANAVAATAPYHWDAQFPDRSTLTQSTIVNLMAGDALLVEPDLIGAYIDELTAPPIAPPADAAQLARGQLAFDKAACQGCHPSPLFTDLQRHAILAAEPTSPSSLREADTPSLRGLFLRAPYLHDGRSPTLQDLLTRGDLIEHGVAADLTDAERADLIGYLNSL